VQSVGTALSAPRPFARRTHNESFVVVIVLDPSIAELSDIRAASTVPLCALSLCEQGWKLRPNDTVSSSGRAMAHDTNRSRAASGDLAKPTPAAAGIPQPGRRIVSIQYLRALAALAVVVFHADPNAFTGQAGVDIFFVISGYIMWMIARSEPTILNFISARVTRIVPLYWLATMIMSLHLHAPADAVAKSMLFIPFIGEQGRIWPVLVPGWTLD
jgi:Acyltransferase family